MGINAENPSDKCSLSNIFCGITYYAKY